jgi:hypothetical protein
MRTTDLATSRIVGSLELVMTLNTFLNTFLNTSPEVFIDNLESLGTDVIFRRIVSFRLFPRSADMLKILALHRAKTIVYEEGYVSWF